MYLSCWPAGGFRQCLIFCTATQHISYGAGCSSRGWCQVLLCAPLTAGMLYVLKDALVYAKLSCCQSAYADRVVECTHLDILLLVTRDLLSLTQEAANLRLLSGTVAFEPMSTHLEPPGLRFDGQMTTLRMVQGRCDLKQNLMQVLRDACGSISWQAIIQTLHGICLGKLIGCQGINSRMLHPVQHTIYYSIWKCLRLPAGAK